MGKFSFFYSQNTLNDTFNKNFGYWKVSNYTTGVIYFQFCAFQYRNTSKLNLNIKSNVCILILKCAELKIDYSNFVITGFPDSKIFIECIKPYLKSNIYPQEITS